MTASDHPALAEVLEASLGLGDPATREHLERCGACRRLASLGELPRAPELVDDRFRIEAWIATGRQLGGQISGDLVPELVAAELTDRRGDRATARAIVARACGRVRARLARFTDPTLATAYAGRVETRRLAARAEAWGLVH